LPGDTAGFEKNIGDKFYLKSPEEKRVAGTPLEHNGKKKGREETTH